MNLVNLYKQENQIKITTVDQETGEIIKECNANIHGSRGLLVFTINGSSNMTHEMYENLLDVIRDAMETINEGDLSTIVIPDMISVNYIKI